jgi:cytochrome c-type biogenesis protein CcmF
MTAELGLVSLLLALSFALLMGGLSLVPLKMSPEKQALFTAWIRPLAIGQAVFVSLAFGLLVMGFLNNDFSIKYVASNSHTDLPLVFKVSATWGAHEGSLLLWAWVLSVWTAVAAWKSKKFSDSFALHFIGVLGWISLGFLSFLILTSSPFERLLDVPAQGRSLNPLLQDIGLAIHPPILYMGYVGLAIPFAFAIAVLLQGHFKAELAAWLRNWILIAWAFLTLGIAIGSWWAYYELGWGGWWFWDPVENASLLPWIVATALLHSLWLTLNKNQFQAWTLLLAILAFSLSLLGTFLVRSGGLTSVHAFTTDPSRGVFILVYLSVVVGLSLMLFGAKAPQFSRKLAFTLRSKEALLLFNNVILMTMMGTILLGTLYPLLLDALNLGKISVGAPYFNTVMLPLTLLLASLMGLAFVMQWRETPGQPLLRKVRLPLILSALTGLLVPLLLLPDAKPLAMLGLALSSWVALAALMHFKKAWSNKHPQHSWPRALSSTLGHLGFSVTLTGIFLTSLYSVEQDVRLTQGQTLAFGEYQITFHQVTRETKDNYLASIGHLSLSQNGLPIAELRPEKRTYLSSSMPMTEAAIESNFLRDVFIALGEPLEDSKGLQAWSFRIQLKPFISWIWLGALMMALAALIGVLVKRPMALQSTKSTTETVSVS